MNSQKYVSGKDYSYLLMIVAGILFFILFAILAYFNRLPYEDYTFISLSKDISPLKAMSHIYETYSARWSAHSLAFSFSMLYEQEHFLFCFNLITVTTFFTSIFLLLKKILGYLFEFKIQNKILLAYSGLFSICFFFTSYNIGQAWFWYMVSWMYMWSIISGNFLMLILLSKKPEWWRIPLLVALTAYIAGAAESYAVIYIFILAAILVLKKQNIISDLTSKISALSLILTLTLLILFFTITLFAPGTWARKNMLTDASFSEHIIMVMKAYGKIILFQTPALTPYLLIFGMPWMLLGLQVSAKEKTDIKSLIPAFIKSVFGMAVLVLILIIPASWILYDLPPARALSQVSLLMAAYVSFVFFYIGYKVALPAKRIIKISVASLTVGVLILCFQVANQYTIAGKYAMEYDKRIMVATEHERAGRKTTLLFKPLPPSGMIYSDEYSADSLQNNYFEKLYGLSFHIAAESK